MFPCPECLPNILVWGGAMHGPGVSLLSQLQPSFLYFFWSSRLAQPSSSKVVTQIYGMVKPIMGNKLVLMFILWFTNVHIKVTFCELPYTHYPGSIPRDILESLNVTWCEWKLTFRFHPCVGATESASFSSPWSHWKWERAENWDELTLKIWVGQILIRGMFLFTYISVLLL